VKNRIYHLCLIFLLFFTINNLIAQSTYHKKFNQNNNTDFIIGLTPTIDNGIVFLSKTALTKLDCSGNVEWTKDVTSFEFHAKGDILEIENGDILITRDIIEPFINNRKSIVVARFDSLGNLIWQKKYGTLNRKESPLTLTSTLDGGFLITGSHARLPYEDVDDFYFFKIDELGNVLWAKTFGESNINNLIKSSVEDQNGNTIHYGFNRDTSGIEKGFIIKLNLDGEVIFYKIIENDSNKFYPAEVILSPDGNYLITGTYINDNSANSAFIMKVNINGEIIYTKKLTTSESEASDRILSIIPTLNGGYAIMGQITNGFPQYTIDALFPQLVFISTFDENKYMSIMR